MAKAREALRLKRFNRNPQPIVCEEPKNELESSIHIESKEIIPENTGQSIDPEVVSPKKEEEPMQESILSPIPEEEKKEELPPPPIQKKTTFRDLFILPSENNEEMEIITEKPVPRTIPKFPISQYAKMKQPSYQNSYSQPPYRPNLNSQSTSYSQNRPIYPSRPYTQPTPTLQKNYSSEEEEEYDDEEDEEEEEYEIQEPPFKKQRPNPTIPFSQPVSSYSLPSQGILQRLGGMYNSIPAPIRTVASTYGPNVLVAIGSGVFLFTRALLQKWSLQSSCRQVNPAMLRVDSTTNQITQPMAPVMSVHIPTPSYPSGGDFSNF